MSSHQDELEQRHDDEALVDYEADEEEEEEEEEDFKETTPKTITTDASLVIENDKYEHGKEQSEIQQSQNEFHVDKINESDTTIVKETRGSNGTLHNESNHKSTTASDVGGGKLASNNVVIKSGSTAHGVYIPPFRRRKLEEEELIRQQKKKSLEEGEMVVKKSVPVVSSIEQRQKWEALKKTINGTINRLNTSTIKELIHSLFQNANLIRGKGLLVKSILRAATTSPTYAPIYTSLVGVINTKLPEIGELVLVRSILTFRKSYSRQDRSLTMSITNFIGCLFNQGLCHELLCLQLLTVLLDGDPTDDSVEVAVNLTKVVGMALTESSPAGVHAVMERFRHLLHDGSIGRRVQYKIEELMKIRKNRFKDYPALVDELDLVEREEQVMFEIGLDDEGLKKEDGLDVFRFDNNFVENENDWMAIRNEILGEDSGDDGSDSSGDGESSTDEDEDDTSDDEDDEDGVLEQVEGDLLVNNEKQIVAIHDMSEKDLINLRRKIYLTIMSSATFEECAHKLAKLSIPPGKEMELINMIIECCSQERTILRYYGLISSRFCLLNQRWSLAFLEAFEAQYNTIHRLETNKLRNVAKLFAHLLHTDSLPWSCLAVIHLNEDETTSSSRIFLKILVQEIAEAIGIGALVKRFESDDPMAMEWYKELFPKDNPRKTRYAINFFTSIGLGPLTDGLRDYLKNAPKLIMMQAEAAKKAAIEAISSSDDSSSVSSTSSSSSSSVSSSSVSSSSSSSSYTSTSTGTSSSDESSVSSRARSKRNARSNKKRSRGQSRSGSGRRSSRDSSRDKSKFRRSSRRGGRSISSSSSRSRSITRAEISSKTRKSSRNDSLDRNVSMPRLESRSSKIAQNRNKKESRKRSHSSSSYSSSTRNRERESRIEKEVSQRKKQKAYSSS